MDVLAAAFIAAAAALLSSLLTARHMKGVTDTQITAERARTRGQLQVELRRERIEEVRALLAEVQTALRVLSWFLHEIERNPTEDEAHLLQRLGHEESPAASLLQLLPKVLFKLPVGEIEDSWKTFSLEILTPLPADVANLPGAIRTLNPKKVVDLRTSLDAIQNAVDAYIVGDDGGGDEEHDD